ncbi:hypothetical protein NA57DRAFT_81158 [Rhizodiscina lignyota]|uniref:separase n=1 Tax=Rhizodiscina lignyota TaxID=1504668 RepID=A0A9P4M1K2_9PEZI|nr:hypothetical protein NA57DRAFT_81158 [Rhizodiscina lignyota]
MNISIRSQNVDAVRAACSSTTCTAATVSTLQQLLQGHPTSRTIATSDDKENGKVKGPGITGKDNAVARKAPSTGKASARTKTKAATVTVAAIKEEGITDINLSQREKFALATEVFNSTLKTISDTLKAPPKPPPPQPREHERTSSPSPDHRKRRSPLTRTSSTTLHQHVLQTITNSPSRRGAPLSRRSSSILSKDGKVGPSANIVAAAECARLALVCLRGSEPSGGKLTSQLQLEQGALALIGKMLAHGLDDMAAKEMRIVKSRLRMCANGSSSQTQDSPIGQKVSRKANAPKAGVMDSREEKDKFSLSSLLQVGRIQTDSPALSLIITYLFHVLKLLSNQRRPASIEAALEHFECSDSQSLSHLLMAQLKKTKDSGKTAKQFENLARTLLSLCPSVSSTADAAAINAKTHPSPETIWRLQLQAFEARVSWWGFTKHTADVEKELWGPLAKCAAAFVRRSTSEPEKQYQRIFRGLENLKRNLKDNGAVKDSEYSPGILRVLSTAADHAGNLRDAKRWTLELRAHLIKTKMNNAHIAACDVKLTALEVEMNNSKAEAGDMELALSTAVEKLHGNLEGTAADQDLLLSETMSLRKALTRWLLRQSSENTTNLEALRSPFESCCKAIAALCHFIARYTGAAPREQDDAVLLLRFGEKCVLAKRVIKSLLDSLSLYAKGLTHQLTVNWSTLDQALCDCSRVIRELNMHDDNTLALQQPHDDGQSLVVKVSSIYWNWYVQQRRTSAKASEDSLHALRRSIDILRDGNERVRSAGGFVTKLERLGGELSSLADYKRSAHVYYEAAQALINNNVLKSIAESSEGMPIMDAWEGSPDGAMLERILKLLQHTSTRAGDESTGLSKLVAADERATKEKGVLLEWVLLSIANGKLQSINASHILGQLAVDILDVYRPDIHPLRHRRVVALLLHLSVYLGNDDSIREVVHRALPSLAEDIQDLAQDAGLAQYKQHYLATLRVAKAFVCPSPSIPTVKTSLLTWQAILDSSEVHSNVDDLTVLIQQLQMVADFLAAKGEEYLRLATLRLLEGAFSLQHQKMPCMFQLIQAQCCLSLQYVHLGYSGKAHSVLAKARDMIEALDVTLASVESRLGYYLAYSQYLHAIGDVDECKDALETAQLLAESSQGQEAFAVLSKSSSGRIRCSRLLADAAYATGICALEIGDVEAALLRTKRAVKLNRSVWASLENKPKQRPFSTSSATETDTANNSDGGMLAEGIAKLSIAAENHVLPVQSMTHEALNGPAFWSLVPSLCRAEMQMSQIYAWLGIWQEAVYHGEQAERVAEAVGSRSLLLETRSRLAEYWSRSGRVEKAEEILESALAPSYDRRNELTAVHLLCERARISGLQCETDQQNQLHSTAMSILKWLMSASFASNVDRITSDEQELERGLSGLNIGQPRRKKTPKAGEPKSRSAKSIAQKMSHSTKVLEEALSLAEVVPLAVLKNRMLRLRVTSTFSLEESSPAGTLIEECVSVAEGKEDIAQKQLMEYQMLLRKSMAEMATDLTFNVLPESTISFPALTKPRRRLSLSISHGPDSSSLAAAKGKAKSHTPKKKATRAKVVGENFVSTLQNARDCLLPVRSASLQTYSNATGRGISRALGESSLVLSAACATNVGTREDDRSSIAFFLDLSTIHGLYCEYSMIHAENAVQTKGEMLKWPRLSAPEVEVGHLPNLSSFQHDFVDILPPSWTAISLTLNDTHDELFITKYEASQSPFVLRLPMARHKSRDMDEDIFAYEDGKAELRDIIELSNFSTHSGKDMSVKGAKSKWWAEREALNARLGDLLQNIENIWLGGFKGIFAQQRRDSDLLARLQKSLQKILERHLPSRQGKKRQISSTFDSRILELFTGLGDPTLDDQPGRDLDEELMDLFYFLVDILQFNGEKNAYDEIDFDSLIVETADALSAYHQVASHSKFEAAPHTILILDKTLHAFPWESLPCLAGLSVSRLPSMEALRERLAAMHSQMERRQAILKDSIDAQQAPPGYYVSMSSGTSILNPSGDLSGTQSTLAPQVDQLPTSWTKYVGPAAGASVDEKRMSTALCSSEVLLYFGHGSTAQYIRPRSVRKLCSAAGAEDDIPPACATALLMGCSSAAITENGEFSPHGMVLAYLAAGAPAVVGCLWDVTDRDCDRFSVECGRRWGLWHAADDEDARKDTKKKGYKKRAKDDVENARDASTLSRSVGAKTRLDLSDALDVRGESVSAPKSDTNLAEAVAASRDACYLKYLNGAAMVVYGIPVYLDSH